MTPFELRVTVPADSRFADTVGALAREAARQAGRGADEAARFGDEAEAALRECLAGGDEAEGQVAVVFRRADQALEVSMTGPAGVKVARTLRIGV